MKSQDIVGGDLGSFFWKTRRNKNRQFYKFLCCSTRSVILWPAPIPGLTMTLFATQTSACSLLKANRCRLLLLRQASGLRFRNHARISSGHKVRPTVLQQCLKELKMAVRFGLEPTTFVMVTAVTPSRRSTSELPTVCNPRRVSASSGESPHHSHIRYLCHHCWCSWTCKRTEKASRRGLIRLAYPQWKLKPSHYVVSPRPLLITNDDNFYPNVEIIR